LAIAAKIGREDLFIELMNFGAKPDQQVKMKEEVEI
jgi:hypothetical protein